MRIRLVFALVIDLTSRVKRLKSWVHFLFSSRFVIVTNYYLPSFIILRFGKNVKKGSTEKGVKLL